MRATGLSARWMALGLLLIVAAALAIGIYLGYQLADRIAVSLIVAGICGGVTYAVLSGSMWKTMPEEGATSAIADSETGDETIAAHAAHAANADRAPPRIEFDDDNPYRLSPQDQHEATSPDASRGGPTFATLGGLVCAIGVFLYCLFDPLIYQAEPFDLNAKRESGVSKIGGVQGR